MQHSLPTNVPDSNPTHNRPNNRADLTSPNQERLSHHINPRGVLLEPRLPGHHHLPYLEACAISSSTAGADPAETSQLTTDLNWQPPNAADCSWKEGAMNPLPPIEFRPDVRVGHGE